MFQPARGVRDCGGSSSGGSLCVVLLARIRFVNFFGGTTCSDGVYVDIQAILLHMGKTSAQPGFILFCPDWKFFKNVDFAIGPGHRSLKKEKKTRRDPIPSMNHILPGTHPLSVRHPT